MKAAFWFAAAVLLHVAFLLFGKALFPAVVKHETVKVTEVDLTETAAKEEEKPQEQEQEKVEEAVEAAPEQMVDLKAFEAPQPAGPAALAPMSLSDLAGALNGAAGESFFGGGGGITSGGVIGGTGSGVLGGGGMDGALGSEQVDEKPRAMGSPDIKLPPELRKAKGKVVVKVVVDETGRIIKPQIESSTNAALNKHVIDGVLAMRFEPATRGGKKVPAKVRLPIVIG